MADFLHHGAAPAAAQPRQEISPARAWYILLLFAALLLSSYVDRFILTVLAGPLGDDLGITRPQMGLLMGIGFSLCYAVVGVPLAWLLDRGTRIRIVTAAALLWGAASLASAFATGYTMLVICRGLIAVGEAALTPAAVSLIPDLFPKPSRRAFPTSVYFSVSVAGATLTYIIGAAALDAATFMVPWTDLAPWRGALILTALPGLLLALLLGATVREPPRLDAAKPAIAAHDAQPSRPANAQHFLRHWPFYLAFYFGFFACTTAPLAVHAWLPTAFSENFGVSVSEGGYWLGLTGTAGGVLGAFGWPGLAALRKNADDNRFKLWLIVATSMLGACASVMLLYPDRTVVTLAFGAMFFFFGAHPPLAALVLQSVAPSAVRARAMAVKALVVILGALSLGPLLVPLVAGRIAPGGDALLPAVAAVAAATAIVGGLTFIIALRHLPED
jgi:MFS family permease